MKQLKKLLMSLAEKHGFYDKDLKELEIELNKLEDIFLKRGKVLKL